MAAMVNDESDTLLAFFLREQLASSWNWLMDGFLISILKLSKSACLKLVCIGPIHYLRIL